MEGEGERRWVEGGGGGGRRTRRGRSGTSSRLLNEAPREDRGQGLLKLNEEGQVVIAEGDLWTSEKSGRSKKRQKEQNNNE